MWYMYVYNGNEDILLYRGIFKMSKNVTVTVPDQLHLKMKKYKERLQPSKIFQDALRQRIEQIERHDRQTEAGANIDALIERLRREKNAMKNTWYETGRTDAIEWVQNASYQHISYVAGVFKTTNEILEQGELTTDTNLDGNLEDVVIGEELQGFSGQYQLGWYKDENGRYVPCDEWRAWEEGFRNAVREFFGRIKDKL